MLSLLGGCGSPGTWSGYLAVEKDSLWLNTSSGRYHLYAYPADLVKHESSYVVLEGRKRGNRLFVHHYRVQVDTPKIKLKGRLIQVAGIGGETPGWAILLSSSFSFQNQTYESIEVYSRNYDLQAYDERNVEVEGEMEWWQGVERGRYPVFRIDHLKVIPH